MKVKIPLWLAKKKGFENRAYGGYYTKFHTDKISKETEKAYIFDELHSFGLFRQTVFSNVVLPKSLTKIDRSD